MATGSIAERMNRASAHFAWSATRSGARSTRARNAILPMPFDLK